MHGNGRFAGATLLIRNDDCFHERNNSRILIFMKAGRWRPEGQERRSAASGRPAAGLSGPR
jgi:hypothetical protein